MPFITTDDGVRLHVEDVERYSQVRAREDIRAVMDDLGIERAHIVGTSMGAFATLHFGFAHPDRARSLVLTGIGYGADPGKHAQFVEETLRLAQTIETQGMAAAAASHTVGPARVQHQAKDPRGWHEFATRMAGHSAVGSANTLRGVQARRPSLWDLTDEMRALRLPTWSSPATRTIRVWRRGSCSSRRSRPPRWRSSRIRGTR